MKASFLTSLIFIFLIPYSLGACPSGYTQASNNKCYKVYNVNKNWFDAEQTCFNANGHLASVESAFIKFNATNDAWLGGYWNKFDNNWAWTDFTKFTYSNWQKGMFFLCCMRVNAWICFE